MSTPDTLEERIEEPLSVFQSILNQIIVDEDNGEHNADYYKEYYTKIMTDAIHHQLQKVLEEYQPINIQGLHTKNNKGYALVELPAHGSQLFIKPL